MIIHSIHSSFSKLKKYMTPFKILLAVELLLFIYGICQYARPLHQYNYKGYDLTATFCEYLSFSDEYEIGCYIDNAIITDNSVDPGYIYITTPYTDLPKGSYQVTITYASDETQRCSATSKFRTYPVIAGHDSMKLPSTDNEMSFSFFSPVKVEEYQIHADYSGNGYLFVESISIEETNAWKNILLFYIILFSFIIDTIILGYRKLPCHARRKARVVIAFITFLTIYTSTPVFSYFLQEGDDMVFHLNRIEAIKDSLLTGQFPNRLSSYWNNGYGYPPAVFYGELFLYVPALLRILGFSIQAAYKFYIIAVNLMTLLIAYYCFKKIFQKTTPVLIGCTVYALAPYRLSCIFLRSAVGEYTAMAFFPLVFYGLYRIYMEDSNDKNYKYNWIPLVLGCTGILQCHILSCIIVGLFIGLFALFFIKRTLQLKRLCQLCKAGIGAVLLNMWFLIPFADYFRRGYTSSGANPVGRLNANGAFFSQIFSFFQSGAGSSHSISESFSYAEERNYALAGFLLIIVLYTLYRLYQGKDRSKFSRIGDCSLAFAAISIFMTTIWFPWDFIQQMNSLFRTITQNIQFPWRFLGITCFFLTITAICLVLIIQSGTNKHLYYSCLSLICAVFLLSADYSMTDFVQNQANCRFIDKKDINSLTIGAEEYLPENLHVDFNDNSVTSGDFVEIISDNRQGGSHIINCNNLSDADTFVDVPFLPYKGYICYDNASGEKLELQSDMSVGKVRIILPPHYSGTFTVTFREPWYWRAAEIISLITLIAGIGYFMKHKKANNLFMLQEKTL